LVAVSKKPSRPTARIDLFPTYGRYSRRASRSPMPETLYVSGPGSSKLRFEWRARRRIANRLPMSWYGLPAPTPLRLATSRPRGHRASMVLVINELSSIGRLAISVYSR
jgi:hypothetical protein